MTSLTGIQPSSIFVPHFLLYPSSSLPSFYVYVFVCVFDCGACTYVLVSVSHYVHVCASMHMWSPSYHVSSTHTLWAVSNSISISIICYKFLFSSHYPLFNISTSNITYSFRQRDRIGVVGPNGVGKSTFLKVLTGSLELAAGSVRLGDTVRIGYYEQVRKNVTCHVKQVLPCIRPPCVHL